MPTYDANGGEVDAGDQPDPIDAINDDIASAIIKRVSELSDRTSPDDQPDMMLVTADELRFIILSELKPD